MEKDKIDQYKENLYSRNYKDNSAEDLERMRRLKKKDNNLKKDWSEVAGRLEKNKNLYKYQKNKTSLFSIIFYISFSFFMLSVGISAFFLYFQKNDTPLNQMEVVLVSPNSIDSGEELEYTLELQNNTKYDFDNVDVYIKYPKSSVDPIDGVIKEKDSVEIDKIISGENKKIDKKIIFSGSPNDKKEVEISINYQIAGYSSILSQKKIFSVKIDSSPVFVKINVPKNVKSKEEFDIDIEVISNSNLDLKNLVLIGRYPNGFEIINNNPPAIFSTNYKNVFRIPELKIGEKKNIKIRGRLIGENSEIKVVSFSVGDTISSNNEIRTVFYSTKEKITIKKPSIDLNLICSDKEFKDNPVVFKSDSFLDCRLKLINNLTTKLTNLKVETGYQDELLVEPSISAKQGYVDSNNNLMIWDKNSLDKLSVLNSGGVVELHFTANLIDKAELAGYIKDPEMYFDFNLSGMSFSNNEIIGKVTNEIKKYVKLKTDIDLVSEVYYDSTPIENYGGPTPVVGKKVSYTITWKIYNSTNKIQDIKVSAKLPPGVEYTGLFYPDTNYVIYDKNTREISWLIKNIEPYIGYRTDPKTLSFQLEYIPVVSEVNKFKNLLGVKKLVATDTFTGEKIEVEAKGDTTRMDKEDYKYNVGKVIE